MLAAVGILLAGQSQAKTVQGLTVEWPPYFDPGLKQQGVVSALVKAAFAASGIEYQLKFVPWQRAMQLVLEGQADVVMGAYLNEERKKKYVFSEPFFDIDVGLITRADAKTKSFKKLKDLQGLRIGVVKGYSYSQEFDTADFLKKDGSRTPALNLAKLHGGRVDAVVMAFGIFRYEAARAHLDQKKFSYMEPKLLVNQLHIIGSKKKPTTQATIDAFNSGLQKIRSNGTYEKIIRDFNF